jgi:thermostable 8-oxoguanine DNA glycosylase
MRTLTDEQTMELENKHRYVALKAELLKEYKSYAEKLEYVEDEYEESIIVQRREILAGQVKSLGAKIREIESWEMQA